MQMHAVIVAAALGAPARGKPADSRSTAGSAPAIGHAVYLIAVIESLTTRGVRKMSSSCFSLDRSVVLNR